MMHRPKLKPVTGKSLQLSERRPVSAPLGGRPKPQVQVPPRARIPVPPGTPEPLSSPARHRLEVPAHADQFAADLGTQTSIPTSEQYVTAPAHVDDGTEFYSNRRLYPGLHEVVYHSPVRQSYPPAMPQSAPQVQFVEEVPDTSQNAVVTPLPNSSWFLQRYHTPQPVPFNQRVIPDDDDNASQVSHESERPYRKDVYPDGTWKVHPDKREVNVVHHIDHFRNDYARPETAPHPMFSAATLQQPRWPNSVPRVPMPATPVRLPEDFAREMADMRSRYGSETLSPQQRDRLVMESYDGFLSELRRKEQALVAHRRTAEMERIRGPLPGWYMRKDRGFTEELHRNRLEVDAKQFEDTQQYMHQLAQPLV